MKKTALITGSSSEIGYAIAKKLGALGYAICIHYHQNQNKAHQLANIFNRDNIPFIQQQADLSKENEIVNLFNMIDTHFGRLDIVINNAAVHHGRLDIESLTTEKLQHTFSINTFATILCCREAVKRMKKQNSGVIINISSEAGTFGGNHMLDYAASKAAINAITKGLAREVGKYNIRVNAISPGIIDAGDNAKLTTSDKNEILKTIPLGRMGGIEDIASLTEWLTSDNATYVSGAVIPITGGR